MYYKERKKMNTNYKEQSIECLDIPSNIMDILIKNKVTKVSQLTKKSKSDLKKLGIENFGVNKIDIELQLLGLSLKGSNV